MAKKSDRNVEYEISVAKMHCQAARYTVIIVLAAVGVTP